MRFRLLTLLFAIVMTIACAKKVAQAPPPPPPAPAAPTVTLSATPDTITAGQTATVTWNTSNATKINISGIGDVSASGSRQVTPAESKTYELVAKGPGGERDASARVTVTRPAAQMNSDATDADLFSHVRDVYFDYDRYTVRADQSNITAADAKFLNEHPTLAIQIEGHCDDRGSEEYNIALGDNRANAVKAELVKLGVDPKRIRTVSYGKEKPFCSEDNESCWQQNRRDHFVAAVH